MQKRLILLLGVILSASLANAQSICPPGVKSDKLVCLVPQIFGSNGFILPGGSGPPQLVNSFANNSLGPLNSAIASQSILLNLASPSSGITYAWDRVANTYSPTTESFGSVYGNRAENIEKYKTFLGLGYQHFSFSNLDGSNLKHLPEVFTQPDTLFDPNNPASVCSVNGNNTGQCAFIRDVVRVDNRIDLKVNQVVTFITFGLTNRIDLSAAIPIENVRMSAVSNATIVDNSGSPFHAFAQRPDCGSATTNCLNQSFSSASRASGIGDITFRVKGTVWKGEKAGLALGTDIRVPTGDALNFLGAGAAGVKPFVVWSYRRRISPHAGAGFQINGSSSVIGNIATGSKERLPSQFDYTAGADVWITKRITAAFDLTGQTLFQSQRLTRSTFTELGACLQAYPGCFGPPFAPANVDANVIQSTANLNILNTSVGFKMKLVSNLLFVGNFVLKMNDSGLRANAIPLAEISYTF